jgi:hypothetical protein
MRSRIGAILLCLVLTAGGASQEIHLPERYNRVKAENGIIIGWHVKSEDRQAKQIDVYGKDGKLLLGLDLLRLVPEAKWAQVNDVSARPGGFIAVAAVYLKDAASSPAAALLCFDFRGNLLTSLALAPSRDAWRLTVDPQGNIWTLTAGAGDLDPSQAPMVVGYTASGTVVRELFKRSEFPLHASQLQENPTVGAPGFGHTAGAIWFWLPGSTDEVTFSPDGSSARRSTTGLPTISKHGTMQRLLLTDGGTLLAQVWNGQEPSFFSRSAMTNVWRPFAAPCSQCTLIGADSGNALFIKWQQEGSEIYAAPLPE